MNDEAHLSAEQSGSEAPSRFPRTHGDAGWPQRDPRTPFARPQEPERLIEATRESALDPVPAVMGRRADFLAANRGQRAPMPGFVLLVRERADGDPAMRYGITVTKKIGGAVVRNRMKRRFRVLARALLPIHGVAGADHVLIGRADGVERDFTKLRQELEKALQKVRRADSQAGAPPFRHRRDRKAKSPASDRREAGQ